MRRILLERLKIWMNSDKMRMAEETVYAKERILAAFCNFLKIVNAMIAEEPKRKRTPQTPEARKARAQLLESLIYEMWDGKPVYYAGYKDVIAHRKTIEQVMSSSLLQSRLATKVAFAINPQLANSPYEVLGNELGVQFKKGD